MELSYTLRICFGFFFILVKEFVCHSNDLKGMCWEEYKAEIKTNGTQVMYVCTSSPLSNETDTVYMDMANVPLFENSTCYCTVTFTNGGDLNSVRLMYEIDSPTDALTVNGFGMDRFNTEDKTHIGATTLQVNYLTFKLTSPESDFKSCLRITSVKTLLRKSLFRAKCFPNQFTPEMKTSSSTKTSTTPTTILFGESTMGKEFGESTMGKEFGESTMGKEFGAIIGGATGGGAVLVITIIIVVLVLAVKRKKTKATKTNNEEYYMTENDLYNVRNSSIKSANENTYDTYDEIEAANETRESRIYAQVDKNKNKPNANTKQPHTVNENEYNHLNDLKGPVSTGNIYSSMGKRGSDPGSNIYNTTHQSTLGNANSGCKDDQVYGTSDEL